MSVAFMEQLLSAKMKTLFESGIEADETLGTPDLPAVSLPVMTFWETLPEGQALEDVRSKISIGIDPRGYTDQVGWQAHFTGWISVEWDGPNTNGLAVEYGRMIAIAEQWQHAAAGASIDMLNVSGFAVDDFQILTGGDSGYDPERDLFFALVPFEIDGTLTSR